MCSWAGLWGVPCGQAAEGNSGSPGSIAVPRCVSCPLSICIAVQIGGHHNSLFGGTWVSPPCSHNWGRQGTCRHPASPAKPLWGHCAAAAFSFNFARRQKWRLLRVKFTLISWAFGMQGLPSHSLPLGCGAESQHFGWNDFGPNLWG